MFMPEPGLMKMRINSTVCQHKQPVSLSKLSQQANKRNPMNQGQWNKYEHKIKEQKN